MGSYSLFDNPDADHNEAYPITEYLKNNTLPCNASLSDKLKHFRMQNRFSYEQMAAITGLCSQLLQKIEERRAYPSLRIMHQLIQSLQKANNFAAGSPVEWGYTVILKDEIIQSRNERPHSEMKGAEGTAHAQTCAAPPLPVKAYIITLEGSYVKKDFSIHNGEEFIHVKKGAVKVSLGANEVILNEGDSIYFLSLIPHKIENVAPQESIIHVIVYQD